MPSRHPIFLQGNTQRFNDRGALLGEEVGVALLRRGAHRVPAFGAGFDQRPAILLRDAADCATRGLASVAGSVRQRNPV